MKLDVFETEARAFLDGAAPLRRPRTSGFHWGEGSDRVALFRDLTPEQEQEQLDAARRWRRRVFDAGFGWLTGPPALGGRGLPRQFQHLYDLIERQYDIPPRALLGVSVGNVAPTLAHHGTDEQQRRWLPALQRGDLVACQLFSEPDAGSDLAAVKTRARLDGDAWILEGDKVWTSGAHYSDLGLALARTETHADRHKGLSMFVVDMSAPGVEVSGLRQMTGGSSFNEVHLGGVSVPDRNRLGPAHEGWPIAVSTLMNERAAIGGPAGGGSGIFVFDRYVELVRACGRSEDSLVRDLLVRVYIGLRLALLTRSRAETTTSSGGSPGPEMSIGKLALIANLKTIEALVSTVIGPALVADSGSWGTYAWAEFVNGVPGLRIGGGTDEIQRNILAERVLGLPRGDR